MKTSFLILSLFFALHSISVAQSSSIKLNQTFSCRNINSIDIDVQNPNVELKRIKGSILVIEISVEISSTNFRLLEFVGNKGRYNMLGKIDTETQQLRLQNPTMRDEIKVKGEKIKEQVRYTLYIPENKKITGVDLLANQ
jgi:hypothetical protein